MTKKTPNDTDALLDAIDEVFDGLGFDDEKQVRLFQREDGREVIVIQANAFSLSRLYVDGRPDGKRIGEFDSYFSLVEHEIEAYRAEHGSDAGFELEPEMWGELFDEARDRYARYLFFAGIERWEDVERDTRMNLTVCDWARRYADEETAWGVYQYKGYILMMHAIAEAELALERMDLEGAANKIEEGIEKIGAYCRECLLSGHEDAEQITREHYLANILKYRDDLIMDGRLPEAGRSDPRNVV